MKKVNLFFSYARILIAILGFEFLVVFQSAKGQSFVINTIAGNGTKGFSGDGGAAINAELSYPVSVCIDDSVNIYIVDLINQRVRKINKSGIISTIAGIGVQGYSGDGGPATAAELGSPMAVAVDGFGNVYIADATNNRIRKINSSGVITTVAGNGTAGFSGDGGAAMTAEINNPQGVTVDGSNIYIADAVNHRIRKVDGSGIITTLAGNGTSGYSGDGGYATAAALADPESVTVDASGNIYIADETNNRVRKVNTGGIITTIAGSGVMGFSGDGGSATSAQLSYPEATAIDGAGNLYIVDGINQRIRLVNTSGIISTIAGNGTQGYFGDGGPATAAELGSPQGVAVDISGRIYIADQTNNRIRRLDLLTGENKISPLSETILFPSPNGGLFNLSIKNLEAGVSYAMDIYNILGEKVFTYQLNTTTTQINMCNNATGIYMYRILMGTGSLIAEGKFIIQK